MLIGVRKKDSGLIRPYIIMKYTIIFISFGVFGFCILLFILIGFGVFDDNYCLRDDLYAFSCVFPIFFVIIFASNVISLLIVKCFYRKLLRTDIEYVDEYFCNGFNDERNTC